MPWPLASDFQTILQNPRIAFRDPYLRSCSIEKDVRGQPRAWSGSFAVVYKGIDESGNPVAIRVFSTESPHRHARYEKIGDYLRNRRVACLVSFEYREEEIRSLSDGKRYPIVLMDWVEGDTLFQWVRNQCRWGDVAALSGAAQQWPAVIAELSREQIAHGDLQHANIMVTPQGELKLVDYDGMCVPPLVGAESLEVGTPPYQHPQRKIHARLSLRLDDFSALLIQSALHALAADPALWGKHVEQTDNEKLLFREDDFRFPQSSPLRQDLRKSAKSYVREMAECLFAAAEGNMDSVPVLDDILQRCQIPTSTRSGDPTPPQTILSQHSPADRPPHNIRPRNAGTGPISALRSISMPNLPGYKLIAEVGRGALATVFLAKSELTGQQVAVKVMPIKTPATEILRRRFLAEMERAAQARHPNIVGMLECGSVDHSFYFVNEYCGGGNLAQWMEVNGGRLRSADLRHVMQQCLDALKHAHLHRLVHGSITPQNILFSNATGPRISKISDFAVATKFVPTFSSRPNHLFDPYSACFMPPEGLTSNRGLTSQSDLWSLAAVFYCAISASCPWDFRSRDPLDVIPREDPVPIQTRDSTITASVAEVIDRALRRNPAQRYPSAAAMKAGWDAAFVAQR